MASRRRDTGSRSAIGRRRATGRAGVVVGEPALEGDEAGGDFGHGAVPRQECHVNILSPDIPDTMPCVAGAMCISNSEYLTNFVATRDPHYSQPRLRKAARSTPGDANQPSTPYWAPMLKSTSLFPYGIRSGVLGPEFGYAESDRGPVLNCFESDARRGPDAIRPAVLRDRTLSALRDFLPNDGAPTGSTRLEFFAPPSPTCCCAHRIRNNGFPTPVSRRLDTGAETVHRARSMPERSPAR